MWNIIKEYRHYLATLVLVIVPVVALNAGGKSPAEFHWLDRVAISLSSPAQAAIRWSIDTLWDGMEDYVLLLRTEQNNQSLAMENRRLLNEIASLQEMSQENSRLKKLVEFNTSLDGKKIVAQVIAQDVSPEFRTIRLNKGSNDQVEVGMAVIALEGIVGRVIRVSKSVCDVVSLLDSSSAIDALLQRNRVRGVVEGQGGGALAMKYLRRTDDVQEGDIIISSGIGGLFPKGLNIGKVASVKKKNYGISQQVEVNPAVDFNRLEEVTIIDPPKVPLDQAVLDPVPPSLSVEHRAKLEAKEKKDAAKETKIKTNEPKTPKALETKPKTTEPKAEKKGNPGNT